MLRSYTELLKFSTLEERFRYLALNGEVGCATFGSRRWMNQAFYASHQWRNLREHIIYRDGSSDLGISDWPIHSRAHVHHINPLSPDDIENFSPALMDPENLITCTHDTHNAIHYGDERHLPRPFIERREGDTKEW